MTEESSVVVFVFDPGGECLMLKIAWGDGAATKVLVHCKRHAPKS